MCYLIHAAHAFDRNKRLNRSNNQICFIQAYPEDEHELIAAYAHQLANAPEAKNMGGKSNFQFKL